MPDTYGLPRDANETRRLNEQNQNLLRTFAGYHIHPRVDTKKPALKVADISCGSGIWLCEVAQLHPQAECYGFDISAAQFPPPGELEQAGLSSRVQFHVRDAADTSGPGAAYEGIFDIVNIRLMHINLIGPQWEQAVKNAVAMLKPGGFLQWQDWDPRTACLAQARPGVKHQAMSELFEGFKEWIMTRDTAQTARIGEMMVAEGLVDVSRETYILDPEHDQLRGLLGNLYEVVGKVIRGNLVGREGSKWTEERVAKLESEVGAELKENAVFMVANAWWYVGQKPV